MATAALRARLLAATAAQVIVLPIAPAGDGGARLSEADTALMSALGIDAARRLRRARLTGAAGEAVVVDLERDRPETVVLAGIGDAAPAQMRRSGAAVGRLLRGRDSAAVLVTAELGVEPCGAFTEGLLLASYRPARAAASPRDGSRRTRGSLRIELACAGDASAEVNAATERVAGTWLARDLAQAGSQLKSPDWLARQAVSAARAAGLHAEVWAEPRLAEEGFGGLLGVAAGSRRPPRLVVLDRGPARPGRHVVLVGKGITFDSGGLSLKPAEAMTTMKTDMAGAAAVLGALTALTASWPPDLRITALLPLAENLPGASALRPGDVLRHPDGTTTEVLNTDAEGRLVLADALAYAVATWSPDVLVDVATLTGAATVALGRGRGALFATSDRLADALQRAGAEAGEPLWRMPLVDDYEEALRSPVADVAHVARDRTVGAGAITAAVYLRRFTGGRPWAHLDIAGPARSESDHGDLPRGATGYGSRLLLRWLARGAPA